MNLSNTTISSVVSNGIVCDDMLFVVEIDTWKANRY